MKSSGMPMPPPPLHSASVSPWDSTTPLIDRQQQTQQQQHGAENVDPKTGKRKLFAFGKTKEERSTANASMDAPALRAMMPQTTAASHATKQSIPDARQSPIPTTAARHPYSSAAAASPSRLRSSSPRLHSPASSEIFERNVQEPVPISTLQGELSPAHIPAHVITEDHIPPALEASANAITSESLNPDEVEIVTSSIHLPAGSVLESSSSHADLAQLGSPALHHHASDASEGLTSLQHSGVLSGAFEDDGASNYGQLDPNDVRRLSFISFADVVQSEHQQAQLGDVGSRDSLFVGSLPTSVHGAMDRAASPLRSPRSPASQHSQVTSGGVVTPPLAANASNAFGEQSPVRSLTGASVGQHGELTIETMRQAVRKTASGDLGGVRSPAMSPISDEASLIRTRSRTNT
ncbi:hypothetical protein Tdes44962_MAKER00809 [Teratosphaeria destructans]|uniref:Uncharacterized protein n=1 Tax=Teratosphaeria destructans TaxID=418781 RepID=A0A9W7SKT0_9PEZI|nr:hypothetical protein Tdes44962_MAKER00809 [Teratosphaeria destructans]